MQGDMNMGTPTTAKEAARPVRTCPQCGSSGHETLQAFSTPQWEIVRCTECGFVYLLNPPAYEELHSDFAWEKTSVMETVRRKKARPLLMWLDQKTRWRLHMLRPSRQDFYCSLFPVGRVLDVGCGDTAGLPDPFVPYGIEISSAMFKGAKEKMTARGGDAVHGAAAEAIVSFPDRFFTGVILSSVVEHEMHPKTLLMHVARVLEDNGKAYIRVPNFGSVNRMVTGSNWCGFRHPDHVNYFTLESLNRMCAECGLEVRLMHPIRLPFDDNINAILSKPRKH